VLEENGRAEELRQFFSSRDIFLGNKNDLVPVTADSHDPSVAVWHTLKGQNKNSVVIVAGGYIDIWQEDVKLRYGGLPSD
jgi:hypothetical protein